MKILFIVTSFNGLSQRAWIELDRLNHQVRVHVASTPERMIEAARAYEPDLVLAPYLIQKIPADIYQNYPCWIVHPGIVGDRGSASLDWAILRGESQWGVTILQAAEKMDAGPVWAWATFPMRAASKSCLYRHEVTQAAAQALLEALRRFESGNYTPLPAGAIEAPNRGSWNRATRQEDFQFAWSDSTESILTKMRAADSSPGVLISLFDTPFYAFGAHPEGRLHGRPGDVPARRGTAICLATGDGALWITHLKRAEEGAVKLPATLALGARAEALPEDPLSPFDAPAYPTYREIRYEETGAVGYLYFDFYNGAMSADQCRALRDAFLEAARRPTRVIALMGGMDLWSNGIHLNVIEAADDPAACSWDNIQAIDDLILAIIECRTHYVISALHGNAGAGGVPFALAADKVIVRRGIVLNPHTRNMGLYGSEYWTYLLPRRIGTERARQFTEQCLPWGADIALEVKLIDEDLDLSGDAFVQAVRRIAEGVAGLDYFDKLLSAKAFKRKRDEAYKLLARYREEELEKMRRNFFDDDEQYDLRRFCFVHRQPFPENARDLEQKDLFQERRKIWRRRKYE